MPTLMKSMNIISRAQSRYRTKMMSQLPSCHHALVLAICRNPGSSQDELAREICLNKSTVARYLDRLEEQGYVDRTSSKTDKRRTVVQPTERMLALLPSVRQLTAQWGDIITADISQEELSVFCSVLDRMEHSAKAAVERLGD